MIAFEEQGRCDTCRIHYEVLVSVPADLVSKLVDFLELEPVPDLVEKALSTRHSAGPADYKVDFTDTISNESVGRGSVVPLELIAPQQKDRMGLLLEKLGYPKLVDGGWPPPDAMATGSDENWGAVDHVFTSRVSPRLLEFEPLTGDVNVLACSISRGAHVTERFIDLRQRRVSTGSVIPFDVRLSVAAETLLQISEGQINLGAACRDGTLKIHWPGPSAPPPVTQAVLQAFWALVRPQVTAAC